MMSRCLTANPDGTINMYTCGERPRQTWRVEGTQVILADSASALPLCLTTPQNVACLAHTSSHLPFCDISNSVTERVADLVSRLSLQEKIQQVPTQTEAQLAGLHSFSTCAVEHQHVHVHAQQCDARHRATGHPPILVPHRGSSWHPFHPQDTRSLLQLHTLPTSDGNGRHGKRHTYPRNGPHHVA